MVGHILLRLLSVKRLRDILWPKHAWSLDTHRRVEGESVCGTELNAGRGELMGELWPHVQDCIREMGRSTHRQGTQTREGDRRLRRRGSQKMSSPWSKMLQLQDTGRSPWSFSYSRAWAGGEP